ncbi:MAG: beta-glucosidase [Janthinobacterium lividum]
MKLSLPTILSASTVLVMAMLSTRLVPAQSEESLASQPWSNSTLPPDQRAALVLAAMTEDEKFAWLSGPMAIPMAGATKPDGALGSAAYYPGIPRLGIPAMQQADASLGVSNLGNVRPGDNATALPSSLLLGATFDPVVARETGAMVGGEARTKGFNVLLAGGANLVREPRGGRNFEYVSEDPLLTGIIAGNSIAGVQSQGVVSTMKHFAVNAQETGRVMVSSDISEPALRESDLLAFQIANEIGKPGSVMPGYNLVNGRYASENAFLINTVLKGDWRYPGWVMSDWGAIHSTEDAILAGLDAQSGANLDPAPFFAAPLRDAVAAGRVPQSRIDDAVRRQLRSLFAVGAIDRLSPPGQPIDYTANGLVAQRAAEAGIVLLRNQGGLLPLALGARRILVVGRHADAGVLSGGGSSNVSPVGSLHIEGTEMMGQPLERIYHPSSPLRAIQAEGGAATVDFINGTDVTATAERARGAEAVIVFAEEWRAESLDAAGLSLPDGQDALIEAVAAANPRTIVVVESGGPVTMPWLDRVPAVLAAFYPGSGGADAIAGILFGRVNPSGKLPVTFPASVAQLPHPEQRDPQTTTSNPGTPRKGGIFHVDYDVEGSDVGYRWFARQHLQPLFPFGAGLSYTSFGFSDLSVSRTGQAVVATLTVTNTGARFGAEVPQLYMAGTGNDGFVPRLVAFDKVWLDPGESRRVRLEADPRLLARFDASSRTWRIAGGPYSVGIGRSADDILVRATIDLPPGTLDR